MSQLDVARQFRAMHESPPLVLPNAWDAASARMVELAGASAVATTSAGISWAYGRGDGQKLRRAEMLDALDRIVRAVGVPVTADVEGGYGDGSPADVAETVRAVLDLGVAGINLEDSPGQDGRLLLEPAVHADRLRAAREAATAAGGDLVINARTDVYLMQDGPHETRLERTVARAAAYVEAGADCVFVPGVVDEETIAALTAQIGAPVNIMAGPGAPATPRLAELGVARVSVGSGLAQAALATAERLTRALLKDGTYGDPDEFLAFGEINDWFVWTESALAPSRTA